MTCHMIAVLTQHTLEHTQQTVLQRFRVEPKSHATVASFQIAHKTPTKPYNHAYKFSHSTEPGITKPQVVVPFSDQKPQPPTRTTQAHSLALFCSRLQPATKSGSSELVYVFIYTAINKQPVVVQSMLPILV